MIVTRLAELGITAPIDEERDRDRTTSGHHATLRARAAVPTAAAKADAWARLISGELSNREFSAVAEGFWAVEQGHLLAPYAATAAHDLADLARRSGQAMGQLIARALPFLPLPDDGATLVAALEETLGGDVPTVARRGFDDRLDDLRRMRATRG